MTGICTAMQGPRVKADIMSLMHLPRKYQVKPPRSNPQPVSLSKCKCRRKGQSSWYLQVIGWPGCIQQGPAHCLEVVGRNGRCCPLFTEVVMELGL